MEAIFLGTSSMQPTRERNLSSILFKYKTENILIDCGEGTQRQMRIYGIPPTKVNRIILTHLHGDHINGLPGFLQNLAVNQYSKTLEIYGPKGTKNMIKNILNLVTGRINLKIHEISSGIFLKTPELIFKAVPLEHTARTFGYSIEELPRRRINTGYIQQFGLKQSPILKDLQQGKNIVFKGKKILVSKATYLIPGKKISLVIDTKYCNNAIRMAKNSDILISEATYADDNKERAREYKHLTAKQAALIAKKSNSKKLILTHFSQRYKTTDTLLNEAKSIFKDTVCAKDFLKIKI